MADASDQRASAAARLLLGGRRISPGDHEAIARRLVAMEDAAVTTSRELREARSALAFQKRAARGWMERALHAEKTLHTTQQGGTE